MGMRKYLIAHDGQIELACIVLAMDPCAAAVKYYETARYCNQKHGEPGDKTYKIGDVTYNDGIPTMKEFTIIHHADLDGSQWLEDVNHISQWAKYGHASINQNQLCRVS